MRLRALAALLGPAAVAVTVEALATAVRVGPQRPVVRAGLALSAAVVPVASPELVVAVESEGSAGVQGQAGVTSARVSV